MHGQIKDMNSEEIQWQKEHEEMHRKHANHDVMHAEILIIFIIALIIFQLLLIWWKSKNFKSYQLVSLLGLWAIPFFVAMTKHWYRFILTWVIFTTFNIYLYRKTNQPHISGKIPRLVYKWFLFLHKMSYFLGVVGYLIMMFTLLGLNTIFGLKANDCLDAGILFLCYGLYYGVLIKDLAEITSEKMACKIGYFTSDGLPKKVLENNICAICGDRLNLTGQLLRTDKDFDDENDVEAVHALSCQHLFHEYCLRGFVIVGKMATCPYCKEKINYSTTFKNPWEKPHLLYGQFLDWVRYLVVWQPLIVIIVQGVTKFFGMTSRKYGFVLKKEEPINKKTKVDNIFSYSDNEEDESIVIKNEIDKVSEKVDSDNDIYDYDGIYEEIQKEKLKHITKKKEDDKKPKYIEKIMAAQKRRELDRFLAEEKKIQKEREEEKGKYGDKEIFISSSYKKKLEEIAQLQKIEEEREKEDEKINEKITKHSVLRSRMYKEFLNNIDNSVPVEEKSTAFRSVKEKKKKVESKTEKSIYDDEDEDEMRPVIKPSIKEEKKVKGGLEIRKKPTIEIEENKIEDIKVNTENISNVQINIVEEKEPQEEVKPKTTDVRMLPKEIRLEKIREIMKQRNTKSDIKAYQKRYMLRKLRGEIVPAM
ncbi:Zinc finger, RING-type domain and Zinc finger, RING/FYVE/PHD-type domain and Domain of unknown function DUF2040 domain-containing protein [Strongyloides ratti]|uniref:RING-type domain-containing protein n=1 Tax=Strongyloides ratti TaxID=34506 RepID=A0A090LJY5_STRRB|nr:Zinc finger, RING-type domain and Zinc finger, RING/FYVE/PHD-type domain and Domain of unknown function DUF2040 domain-containing protein [Strongyloides ratti]CEF67845.1 Zinc finger, RING-type domain and Zinc finger, RING/FYVE/PHD-type domain and Domain of unknown function DUF2040 domain-containing protein [Strongyloides ratti]